MRAIRDAVDPVRRLEAAETIGERLGGLGPFAAAGTIGVYYSQGSEVPTGSLVRRIVEEEGRRALLPFVLNDHLEMTEWRPSDPVVDAPVIGLHPRFRRAVPLDDLDVMVLPGLAFGEDGTRLGYGTGLWEGLLERLPEGTVTIGLAFAATVVPTIEGSAGSRPMDFVVTESGVLAPVAARRP